MLKSIMDTVMKAKSALDILDDEQLETIKRSLNKGGRNGR